MNTAGITSPTIFAIDSKLDADEVVLDEARTT
jgi:hypothetical protein